jgi:hypothetical protein
VRQIIVECENSDIQEERDAIGELQTEEIQIKEIADAYDSIKNNVIDFKNIVA